jgi:hypothetical protein
MFKFSRGDIVKSKSNTLVNYIVVENVYHSGNQWVVVRPLERMCEGYQTPLAEFFKDILFTYPQDDFSLVNDSTDRYGKPLMVGDIVQVVRQGQMNKHINMVGYIGVIEELSDGVAQVDCGSDGMGAIETNCLKKRKDS